MGEAQNAQSFLQSFNFSRRLLLPMQFQPRPVHTDTDLVYEPWATVATDERGAPKRSEEGSFYVVGYNMDITAFAELREVETAGPVTAAMLPGHELSFFASIDNDFLFGESTGQLQLRPKIVQEPGFYERRSYELATDIDVNLANIPITFREQLEADEQTSAPRVVYEARLPISDTERIRTLLMQDPFIHPSSFYKMLPAEKERGLPARPDLNRPHPIAFEYVARLSFSNAAGHPRDLAKSGRRVQVGELITFSIGGRPQQVLVQEAMQLDVTLTKRKNRINVDIHDVGISFSLPLPQDEYEYVELDIPGLGFPVQLTVPVIDGLAVNAGIKKDGDYLVITAPGYGMPIDVTLPTDGTLVSARVPDIRNRERLTLVAHVDQLAKVIRIEIPQHHRVEEISLAELDLGEPIHVNIETHGGSSLRAELSRHGEQVRIKAPGYAEPMTIPIEKRKPVEILVPHDRDRVHLSFGLEVRDTRLTNDGNEIDPDDCDWEGCGIKLNKSPVFTALYRMYTSAEEKGADVTTPGGTEQLVRTICGYLEERDTQVSPHACQKLLEHLSRLRQNRDTITDRDALEATMNAMCGIDENGNEIKEWITHPSQAFEYGCHREMFDHRSGYGGMSMDSLKFSIGPSVWCQLDYANNTCHLDTNGDDEPDLDLLN